MKIAVSTWSFHPWLLDGRITIEELIDFLAENGAEGVEIVDIDFNEIDLKKLFQIKNYAASKGVKISCLSLEHDLSQIMEEDRKADVAKVVKWAEYANKLGLKYLRVFTGWKKENIPYDQQVKWVTDGLKDIAARAEELGVDLVLENHNDVVLQADEILELMKDVNSPILFTCPDVYNYANGAGPDAIVGDNAYDEITKLVPMAKNCHIKYRIFNENGEDTCVDTGRMLDILKQSGYDGYLAIEFLWPYLSEDIDIREEVKKGIELLKKHIKT